MLLLSTKRSAAFLGTWLYAAVDAGLFFALDVGPAVDFAEGGGFDFLNEVEVLLVTALLVPVFLFRAICFFVTMVAITLFYPTMEK
jgi:hypothetical protein